MCHSWGATGLALERLGLAVCRDVLAVCLRGEVYWYVCCACMITFIADGIVLCRLFCRYIPGLQTQLESSLLHLLTLLLPSDSNRLHLLSEQWHDMCAVCVVLPHVQVHPWLANSVGGMPAPPAGMLLPSNSTGLQCTCKVNQT